VVETNAYAERLVLTVNSVTPSTKTAVITVPSNARGDIVYGYNG
jgi:hypothetical protein